MDRNVNHPVGRWTYGGIVGIALVLLVPLSAQGACLGVVPVLIGPLQVLVAVLPALLAALGAAALALVSPSTIKAAARVLWRNKYLVVAILMMAGGLMYAVPRVWALFGPAVSEDVSGGGEWPAFHGGPARRGAAPGSPDPTAAGAVWAFSSEVSTFYASPAVVGKRVYVTSADKTVFSDRGAIYCLDAETGAIVWKHSPGGFRATFSSPAVAEGYVVSGEGLHFVRDGRVTCLRAKTGQLVWELRTGSHVESSPCIYRGKAYVGAGDDGLYCIALEPGPDGKPRVLWHLDSQDYPDCEASPIAYDGRVYFGLGNKGCGVCCVDAETGKPVWKATTPYPVFSAPVIVDGKVFVGMGNGNYIDSAEKLWEKRREELRKQNATEAEVAEARKQYAPAGEVWGLDLVTGKRLCQVKLKDTVLGALAAADGQIYFGSRDGLVTCMDTRGTVLKQWNVRGPIVTSAAVGKDHLYVVTENGRLLGLDRRTLRPAWEAQIDAGPCLSSPAIACGHVYVGTSHGGLVCFGRAGAQERPVWAGYLGGPGRSGWADSRTLAGQGGIVWQYPPRGTEPVSAPAAVYGPPAYLDGSLYVGIHRAERTGLARLALNLSPREGPAEKWFCATPNPVYGSAAVVDDRAYFVDGKPGDRGRSLHAVEAASGRQVWKFPVADGAPGDLVLTQDRLLVRDGADRLSCLKPAGEKCGAVWSMPVNQAVGAPAVVKDLVLVSSSSAGEGVTALDLADGTRKWQRPLAEPATTGPVATEDFVAVGTESGLIVLSIVDGSVLWSARCGPARGVLVCDEDHVACTTGASEVVVLDWLGAEVLRAKDAAPEIPPMLCGDQVVYMKPSSVERVELPSGRSAPWIEADWLRDVTAPPVLVNSHLYFATRTRGLVAAGPGE